MLFDTSSQVNALAVMKILALGAVNIMNQGGMILFNKYLITQGRFPFAIPLIMFQMVIVFTCLAGAYYLKPSLFPALSDPEKKVPLDGRLIQAMPLIGMFFAIQLVLGNAAYLECSLAFLQFMKEGNIVLVYIFSLIAALEVFCHRRAAVLCALTLATSMCVQGELHFSMAGFVMQLTTMVFETSKIVLQVMVLSAAGKKFDAPSYVLVISPIVFAFLSVSMGMAVQLDGHWALGSDFMTVPRWSDFVAWWPMLLLNSFLALATNLTTALFLQYVGGVGICLAGLIKDSVLVFISAWVIGDELSKVQVISFGLQVFLIYVWSQLPPSQPALFPPKCHVPKRMASDGASDALEEDPLLIDHDHIEEGDAGDGKRV